MTIGYLKVSARHSVQHFASRRRRIVSPAFAPGEVIDTPSLRSATSFWVCSSRNVRTRCFAAAAMDPKQSGNAPQTFTTYSVCSEAPPSGTKDTRATEKQNDILYGFPRTTRAQVKRVCLATASRKPPTSRCSHMRVAQGLREVERRCREVRANLTQGAYNTGGITTGDTSKYTSRH